MSSQSDARFIPTWPYKVLFTHADIVVIAVPLAIQVTQEISPLPGLTQMTSDGKTGPCLARGVNATFEIKCVLKGDFPKNCLELHYYQRLDPNEGEINGPGWLFFEPTKKSRYLMFLKKREDGRFEAISGQADPNLSVFELKGSDTDSVNGSCTEFIDHQKITKLSRRIFGSLNLIESVN